MNQKKQYLIKGVIKNTPAGKVGLKKGDILKILSKKRILTKYDVQWMLNKSPKLATALSFTVFRGDELIWGKLQLSDGWKAGSFKVYAIELAKELVRILSDNNISLSIGVYPWPGQLLYDSEDSIQVKIWKDFCKNKFNNFYNLFPVFFQYFEKYGSDIAMKKLFISRDVHFNSNGMSLVSKNFIDMQ